MKFSTYTVITCIIFLSFAIAANDSNIKNQALLFCKKSNLFSSYSIVSNSINDDCLDELLLLNGNIPKGEYIADRLISTNSNILQNNNVSLLAGDTITLLNGFGISANSNLNIDIESCMLSNTLCKLPSPELLTISKLTETQVLLNWDKVPGVEAYYLRHYRDEFITDNYYTINNNIWMPINTTTDHNEYALYSSCNLKSGPYGQGRSIQISKGEASCVCSSPQNISFSINASKVELNWEDSEDAESYIVEVVDLNSKILNTESTTNNFAYVDLNPDLEFCEIKLACVCENEGNNLSGKQAKCLSHTASIIVITVEDLLELANKKVKDDTEKIKQICSKRNKKGIFKEVFNLPYSPHFVNCKHGIGFTPASYINCHCDDENNPIASPVNCSE